MVRCLGSRETCALEGGQGLDRLARLPLRQANLIQALQIHTGLCTGPEEMSQARRAIAGNRQLSVEDFGDAVGGN